MQKVKKKVSFLIIYLNTYILYQTLRIYGDFFEDGRKEKRPWFLCGVYSLYESYFVLSYTYLSLL